MMENSNKTIENWRIKDSDGFQTSLVSRTNLNSTTPSSKYGSNNNNNGKWRTTPINHTLWKKENAAENAMYVNPFVNISLDYADYMQKWNEKLDDLKSAVDLLVKSNKMSDQLIEFGHAEYRGRHWIEALNFYSQALGYAEIDTLYEGLAHGNRALCFFQLEMYQKAVIDFDLAVEKKCPEEFLIDIQSTRVECQKLAKKHSEPKARVPKLLLPDKKFPCMANCVEIKRNKDFGRSIFAKRDIDVGQTVFVAESFASVITTDNQVYCVACHKVAMNFIACKNCSNVMFCNEDCMSWYTLHKMECRTCYHQIEDPSVKFVIQTLLVAIDIFSNNVDNLIKFVEETTSDRGCDKIPKSSCDSTSKYGIFLKLTPSLKDDYMFRAYQAFTCIALIPKVNYLFDTEQKQRFLMQLLLQHTIVIPKNAFFDEVQFSDNYTIEYIFDVLSLVNHSCAPNLSFDTVGKLSYCVAIRPIKKGDQVFINYLGHNVIKPSEERQRELNMTWGFECKCDKCEPSEPAPEYELMRADPSFKYVMRYSEYSKDVDDNTKRMQLKKQCIKFLKKYGHSWTTELDFVTDCFTSL